MATCHLWRWGGATSQGCGGHLQRLERAAGHSLDPGNGPALVAQQGRERATHGAGCKRRVSGCPVTPFCLRGPPRPRSCGPPAPPRPWSALHYAGPTHCPPRLLPPHLKSCLQGRRPPDAPAARGASTRQALSDTRTRGREVDSASNADGGHRVTLPRRAHLGLSRVHRRQLPKVTSL